MTPQKIAAFAFGPIVGALLGFLTLPIVAWFFSQEDIGRMAMLNVAVSFSVLLFSFGLDQAYVREFHEATNKPALFKMVFFPGLFTLCITLIVLLNLDNIISKWMFSIDSDFLSIMVAMALLSAFISRFLSLILRMNERGIAYSLSQVLPKILFASIIGSYLVFSVAKDIRSLVFAHLVSLLCVCLVFAWNTRHEWFLGLKEKTELDYLKRLLSFGFPLIFGGMAFWGLTAIDKILLKELSDYEQLGLYSVAVSFAAVATIFQSVFSTVWGPIVYKWAASGEGLEKIHKITRYVLLVVIVVFCMVGLFSWVLALILPADYRTVQWIVVPCLGFPLLYTLSETTVVGIGITKKTGYSMLSAIIAFLVNLVGNWFLIPFYGASGAAISTCISFWIFFILRTEFSIYLWHSMSRLALYAYTALLVFGAVFVGAIGEGYELEFTIYWLMILLSVLAVFRDEFLEIKEYFTSYFLD